MFQFSENTFKNYYYAEDHDEDSDDLREDSLAFKVKKALAKQLNNNIEDFFETPKKKKKLTKKSSSVARASYGGLAYVCSNKEDAASATHMVKIEIYDMAKIKDIAPTDQWKHADLRVKYYVDKEEDKTLQSVRDTIYKITKQIASESDCVKYFIDNNK